MYGVAGRNNIFWGNPMLSIELRAGRCGSKPGSIQKTDVGLLNYRARKDDQVRGPAMNSSECAELLGFFGAGIRSRNLTPFSHAVPILGLRNGPDFGTVFVTDRARIFVSVPANQEAGLGVGGLPYLAPLLWVELQEEFHRQK